MKVVLFCGGLGTRLREHSDVVPKPLVNVGSRPIIWHLMRYYAHFGHKEFILALGYHGHMLREYFLNYSEALSNDFVLSNGGKTVEVMNRDMDDWRITFVDTGLHSNIGQRLLRVRKYLGDDEMFLANYSDGLSDVPLDTMIDQFKSSDAIASMASVRSQQSFHVVRAGQDSRVTSMGSMDEGDLWLNGGYFVLRQQIFDHINEGEELVGKPFDRLIEQRKLVTYQHPGFWQAMDTFKDKITLDRMEAKGQCPWMIWRQ